MKGCVISSKNNTSGYDISILSILETIAVCGGALVIATYLESYICILISSCLAPFMLFGSDLSNEKGVRLYDKLSDKMSKQYSFVKNGFVLGVFSALIFYPIYLLGSLIIRLLSVLSHPISGIKTFPRNWVEIVFRTDMFVKPEIVSGTGVFVPVYKDGVVGFSGAKSFFVFLIAAFFLLLFSIGISKLMVYFTSNSVSLLIELFSAIVLSVIYVVSIFVSIALFSLCFGAIMCAVGSIAYRVSVKSSAIVWLPLIFGYKNYNEKFVIEERVDEICNSAWFKLKRCIAVGILIGILIKLVVVQQYIEWWNSLALANILNVFVMPGKLHVWHIASVFNAALALFVYYFVADRAESKIKYERWSVDRVQKIFRYSSFFSGVLSFYTIAVGLVLVVSAALKIPGIDFDASLFPFWMIKSWSL